MTKECSDSTRGNQCGYFEGKIQERAEPPIILDNTWAKALGGRKTAGMYRIRSDGRCCVGGKQPSFPAVLPRSDGAGEFGEGRREPMPSIGPRIQAKGTSSARWLLGRRCALVAHCDPKHRDLRAPLHL
jgi:hypothetical protein